MRAGSKGGRSSSVPQEHTPRWRWGLVQSHGPASPQGSPSSVPVRGQSLRVMPATETRCPLGIPAIPGDSEPARWFLSFASGYTDLHGRPSEAKSQICTAQDVSVSPDVQVEMSSPFPSLLKGIARPVGTLGRVLDQTPAVARRPAKHISSTSVSVWVDFEFRGEKKPLTSRNYRKKIV